MIEKEKCNCSKIKPGIPDENKTGLFYGLSDDLIYFEGNNLFVEHDLYYNGNKGMKFSFNDGTKGRIYLDDIWRIEVSQSGYLLRNKYNPDTGLMHLNGNHLKALKGNYVYESEQSEILIFAPGIKWVKLGHKMFDQKYFAKLKQAEKEAKEKEGADFRKELFIKFSECVAKGDFAKINNHSEAKRMFDKLINQAWNETTNNLPF